MILLNWALLSNVMSADIPENHWSTLTSDAVQTFIPRWESSLRASVAAEPDPAVRFTNWLKRKTDDVNMGPCARLVLFEQPYLSWAETVEQIIETTRKDEKKRIIARVFDDDDDV